jgi:antitoxin MazE
MLMLTLVKRWRNSLALRLPQALAAKLRIAEGTTVSLAIDNDVLVVRPLRRRYRLSELLAAHQATESHPETKWGQPKGKEVW